MIGSVTNIMNMTKTSHSFVKKAPVSVVKNYKAPNMKFSDVMIKTAVPAALLTNAALGLYHPSENKKISTLFKENNYKKTDDGGYVKTLTPKEKKDMWTSFDAHKNDLQKLNERTITKDEVQAFDDFLNIADGKALKHSEHFDNLLISFLILKDNGLYPRFKELVQQNSAYMDLVLNYATSPAQISDVNYLNSYKRNPNSPVNEYLRYVETNPEKKIPAGIQEEIDILTKYIDTQTIKEPIKVFRTDTFHILSNVKTKNGTNINLAQIMQDAEGNPKLVNEVREFVADNEISTKQAAFLSTSLNNNIADFFGFNNRDKNNIIWEMTVESGSKGVYLEAFNGNNVLSKENEFLLQRGADIKISDVVFDDKNGIWKIKANVSTK